MGEVHAIGSGEPINAAAAPDRKLVEFAEEMLARVKSGKVVAVGTVEVEQGGKVAVGFCHTAHYHQLNSGAARLSARLSTMEVGND